MFEEILFKNEMAKRLKNKCLWKYHTKELFADNIISFDTKQLLLIKELLYTPLPRHRRRDFWLIASGAKRELLNNKGYYNSLLNNFPNGTQSPAEEFVKLDVVRTFTKEPFFQVEKNRQKLQNILTVFIRRNATIGYSQGLNCIAGKILMVVNNEEEAFWIFTQIIECYLPGDFYLLFTGVRKDMKIIEQIIKKSLKFTDYNVELCINNLISKCFISLFSQGVPDNITYEIWDAFFIYGEIVLYRAFIWIAYLHYDKSLQNKEVEEISNEIMTKMSEMKDTDSLKYFLFMYQGVNNSIIKSWKQKISSEVKSETVANHMKNSKSDIKCDKNMPYCVANRQENDVEKNSQFIVHKLKRDYECYDDYFFNQIRSDEWREEQNEISESKNVDDLNISQDSLLIERQVHTCQ